MNDEFAPIDTHPAHNIALTTRALQSRRLMLTAPINDLIERLKQHEWQSYRVVNRLDIDKMPNDVAEYASWFNSISNPTDSFSREILVSIYEKIRKVLPRLIELHDKQNEVRERSIDLPTPTSNNPKGINQNVTLGSTVVVGAGTNYQLNGINHLPDGIKRTKGFLSSAARPVCLEVSLINHTMVECDRLPFLWFLILDKVIFLFNEQNDWLSFHRASPNVVTLTGIEVTIHLEIDMKDVELIQRHNLSTPPKLRPFSGIIKDAQRATKKAHTH